MTRLKTMLAGACICGAAWAGPTPRPNQISVELGGEGLLTSIHYERLLLGSNARARLLADGGLGWFPLSVNGQHALGTALVPVGLRGLYGLDAHHVELGLTWTTAVTPGIDTSGTEGRVRLDGFVTPSVGYRHADFDAGRWSLGVAYAPRVSADVTHLRWDHYARLGAGVMF